MTAVPAWERYLGVPLLRAHDAMYRKTHGLIGHRIPGAPPSLLLHTTGAKTGVARTTTLTYARDGATYLVVASKGGDPRAPGWFFNLKKQPDIDINVGTQRFPVTARIVTPADSDYPRLWDVVNANNRDRYRDYQKRTSRPIPVIALTPR